MKKRIFQLLAICLLAMGSSSFAQMAVYDGANQTQQILNHVEDLQKWTESINAASEQINKLNSVISSLNDVQGAIGKGLDAIGIPTEISQTAGLAKSLNNFGQAINDLQHSAGSVSPDLDKFRQQLTDPSTWERYAVTSRSYDQTQKAQKDYDEQSKNLQDKRAQAQSILNSAKSIGEIEKARTTLDEIKAAEDSLDSERKRAFEQQQANYIENQNQKDAWEQIGRDWTAKELDTFGKSFTNYLNADLKEGGKHP